MDASFIPFEDEGPANGRRLRGRRRNNHACERRSGRWWPEIAEWSVPKLDTSCIDPRCSLVTIGLAEGRTLLVLPVVDPPRTGADLFR
jgi:hypothetical protein